ncbi:MAG: GGDEF domain-containing protein [bacterium]|nr:GGDEF domain-containing protein [bacterium]
MMKKNAYYRLNNEPDILNGFSRTLAEIEWLLLVLVLFYLVVGQVSEETKPMLILASCLYGALVIFFQYLNFFKEAKAWKIAFQTWVMIIFISWVIGYTGKLHSPLFNLYLLPVIASAITLGKLVTLLEVGLICAIFLYLKYDASETIENLFSLVGTSNLSMLFFPMVLVAYISTMLAADIQMGFSKLKVISEIDDLTKLFNHRTFKYLSEKIIHHAERQALDVSVLMIDADNLKKINDRFGHEAGNLLLSNIAQCLTSVLRGGDIAARYGGDEFVILLPDCDRDNAILVAGRIVDEFKSTQIRYQGETIELSASIGVACFPEQGQNIEALLSKADKAMYASKRQGNNLVTLYTAGIDL